ncbi:MAG: desulfoferrodoxin [Candidatus Komeilibacteria bacterium]
MPNVTKLNEVYKCPVCGNIVTTSHVGGGELVCCGQPMNLLSENTEDAAQEKHVPVITKTDNGVKVVVGSVPHPMDDDHYIEWIEIIINDHSHRHYLKPGDTPEWEFKVDIEGQVIAREYCNLHGLWKADLE